MAKENVITQESFDVLLAWLDRNRETAAQKYEKIRQRLIRIFIGRGCFEAEELADETFNRVTLKLPQIVGNYEGEPMLYFYGVADKIHLEWLRKQKKVKSLQLMDADNYVEESESEPEYECLEACLGTLSADKRSLIVEYYMEEKRAKIQHRQFLAKKLGISVNALQIKTHRIRADLQECVQNCVAEKNS
jgi:RNA polymerase sigma factor (sigma-70 family)